MRISVNPVLDMDTLRWHCDYSYEYAGVLLSFKGDPTAQAAEQSQANLDNQLASMMQTQYANQSATLTYLKNQLTPTINAGGIGYSGADLAAMRTGATDSISNQFQNAEKAANASENQSGLPSGVNAQIGGSLVAAEAQSQSGAQLGITQANEALKQQNYWNAVNALNGVAVENNPLGYANASTAGSGAVAGLSQAVTAANGPTFGQILGGIAGGIGTAVGGIFQGKG